MRFAAIDFETANYLPHSACAVGIVMVEHGCIRARGFHLIRPPSSHFTFTRLHGISFAEVKHAPQFPEVWEEICPIIHGVPFLAAHNSSFDSRVLSACCSYYDLPLRRLSFVCTVRLARERLQIDRPNLAHVCSVLGIPLRHHDALSDAEAAAQIVLHAWRNALFDQEDWM